MTTKAQHYTFEGDLRARVNGRLIRPGYCQHHMRITTPREFKATLRAGPAAWPGGYPLYFITRDGAALCFKCARKEVRQVFWDFMHDASTGWRVAACDVNWEDSQLVCDNCVECIPAAYA